MGLNEIINELKKYDSSIVTMFPGAKVSDIELLEHRINHKLPNDFKNFLLTTNGADFYDEIYGLRENKKYEDLYGNYIAEKDEVGNPIREYYLPITPDGMGNHNCLDLSTLSADGETCNVIFWQHDWFYKPHEQPDIDANSFTEYLEMLLKNIEKQFNYDGSEK